MSVLVSSGYAVLLLLSGIIFTSVVERAVTSLACDRKLDFSMRPLLALGRQILVSDPGHKRVDRVLFFAAAPLALTAVSLALVVIPISQSASALAGPQLKVGVFFFLVILDFMAVALFMAGWGANQESGTRGAFMAAAQLVSYIVPLGFAATGAIMAAQSLSTDQVVKAQGHFYFGLWQPMGVVIYVVAAFGQTYRPPISLPLRPGDADVLVEHFGASAAILKLALYGIWFAAAAMGVVLFFGGWRGPWLPGPIWFFLKTGLILAAMAWMGTRVKGLSMEQVVRGAWLVLIPASIVNIVIVGIIVMVTK